jgi:hypothetical protein
MPSIYAYKQEIRKQCLRNNLIVTRLEKGKAAPFDLAKNQNLKRRDCGIIIYIKNAGRFFIQTGDLMHEFSNKLSDILNEASI